MLDAIEANDLPAAVRRWRPDPACIAAGDEYRDMAVRHYAAAGLSDAQISDRLANAYTIVLRHDTAAIVVARHLAWCGLRAREIVLALADLAGMLPGWPQDPDHLVWIASNADSAENGDG